jgi:hypothetical protein
MAIVARAAPAVGGEVPPPAASLEEELFEGLPPVALEPEVDADFEAAPEPDPDPLAEDADEGLELLEGEPDPEGDPEPEPPGELRPEKAVATSEEDK